MTLSPLKKERKSLVAAETQIMLPLHEQKVHECLDYMARKFLGH